MKHGAADRANRRAPKSPGGGSGRRAQQIKPRKAGRGGDTSPRRFRVYAGSPLKRTKNNNVPLHALGLGPLLHCPLALCPCGVLRLSSDTSPSLLSPPVRFPSPSLLSVRLPTLQLSLSRCPRARLGDRIGCSRGGGGGGGGAGRGRLAS